MENSNQMPLKTLEELNYFLTSAPKNWNKGDIIKRFQIYENEYISCVYWENQHFITGTDIVKALTYRFKIQGHEIKNVKKFEEGIFSDLRNLKPGIDSSLEEPKSPFLELLYKNKCIRTQKKQKVFFWYSVPYDRLYQDVLKRDKKRELNGKNSTVVIDKSKSPVIKRESSYSPEIPNNTEENLVKGEPEMKNTSSPNIIYTKWVDETQKLNNSSYEEEVKVKKEECDYPQLKKVRKEKKHIIAKYYVKGSINGANTNLKFACDKINCNKKFRKLEELAKHKKFVHGADKIGYNYSKDFMYVEKNLSFDKNEKSKSNKSNNSNICSNNGIDSKINNNNGEAVQSVVEYEGEKNNNWNIIITPESSESSENGDAMISNLSSPGVNNISLNNNVMIGNLTTSGVNNNIYSTSDSTINTTYLTTQSINTNSSFIIQSNENSDSTLNNEDQIKFYTHIVKTEGINQGQILTTTPNVSQSFADTVATQSQYIPCEVSSVQPQTMNTYVSVNNNIQNVNEVTQFMTIDSPIQNEGNYYQNVPVQTQGPTQYMTSDQYNQYVPSNINTSTTTSSEYVSYGISSIINPVTNPPLNVYVTSKVASPDHMKFVSSPTAIEYQRMNQPQPQPRKPASSFSNNEQQQAMFYNLPPNDQNSNNMNQTYIQHQHQYVQQPQQQIYQVQHENMAPMVQMQY